MLYALPDEFILKSIPAKESDIKSFMHKFKSFNSMFDEYSVPEDLRVGFVKFCYSIGLFSGSKDDSNKALKFVKSVITKDEFNEKLRLFNNLNTSHFNRDFADFFMDNWEYILSNFNFEKINSLYCDFKKIKKYCFLTGNILSINNVDDYLNNMKFNIRNGNEELYNVIKKYESEYNTNSFNRMQSLYEKAKEMGTIVSKKIIPTKDYYNKNECHYEWLLGDNPLNFSLGNKVGCCAKINSVGEGILVSSILDISVCNLALYGRKNKIIGKATAYFNEHEKYILFNNAEISENIKSSEKKELLDCILRAVEDQVAAQNASCIKVTKVAMGMHNNDLFKQIKDKKLRIIKKNLLNNLTFVSGDNIYYGDANNPSDGQCILWKMHKKNRI